MLMVLGEGGGGPKRVYKQNDATKLRRNTACIQHSNHRIYRDATKLIYNVSFNTASLVIQYNPTLFAFYERAFLA